MQVALKKEVRGFATEYSAALSISVSAQIIIFHTTSEKLWMYGVCKEMANSDGLLIWRIMKK